MSKPGPKTVYCGAFTDLSLPDMWSLVVYFTSWGDKYMWEVTATTDESYPYKYSVISNDNGDITVSQQTLTGELNNDSR